jgi:hypothetical protein
MTERKSPQKSWDSWIDDQIRDAETDGAFANLPGAGKPLPGLGAEYDPDWWVKKLVQREKISELPPALELRRSLQRALDALATIDDEREVRRVVDALNVEIRKVNATVAEGPPTTVAPLDVEDVVRSWRGRR